MKFKKRILPVLLALVMVLPCLPQASVASTPTNKEIVYTFLKTELDVNDAAVCGIMANIQCESSFRPNAQYTEADGSLSFGICQWNRGRLENLKSFCSKNGYSSTSLTGQLYYLKHELQTSEKNAYSKVKNVENNADGAYQAGYNWAKYFERCASSRYEMRAVLARDTYWPEYGSPKVQAGIIMERIEKLQELLENKYFTVNQKGCRTYVRSHSCSNCLSSSIVKTKWFIDMFGSGINATKQFPLTYYSDGKPGSRYGWSCYGFAGFAEWYIFKNSNTDVVDTAYVGTFPYDYENCLKQIRLGDLLRLSDTHSAIAISVSETGVLVLDCNYLAEYNCLVATHEITYEAYSKVSISRSTNAVEAKQYNIRYNANGGTINGGGVEKTQYTVISPNGLNMRSGPGTSYGRLVALPYNTVIIVSDYAEADGYTWGYGTYKNISGWIVISENWTRGVVIHETPNYLSEDGMILDTKTDKPLVQRMTAGLLSSEGLKTAEELGLTRADLTFIGWSVAPDEGQIYSGGSAVIPDELFAEAGSRESDLVLYAVWDCPHLNSTSRVVAPTCTEDGYTLYTCMDCGAEFRGEIVKATGHVKSSEGGTVVPPTCTEPGCTLYICEICHVEFEDDPVEPAGHKYEAEVVAPTCEEQGYTIYTCSECHDSYVSDYTDPGHKYVPEVVAPTCEAQGYTVYTCSECHHSYKDDFVDPTGHKYEAEVVAPTCTEKGYTVYTCPECHDSYVSDYTDPTGHKYVPEVIAPTCTEQGYTVYTCSECHDHYEDDRVDALGHDYQKNVTPSTCTTYGHITYICSRCRDSYEEQLTELAPHSYSETVVPPTEEAEGYTEHTCTACGHTYRDEYTGKIIPRMYRVAFDPSGGVGQMAAQEFRVGVEKTLSLCAFARKGYTFAGWKTEDGTLIGDGASVKDLSRTDGAVVTLTAAWKLNSYTVTFDPNGGHGTMPAQEFEFGVYQTLRANTFDKPGSVFLGWALSRTASAPDFWDEKVVWNLTNENGGNVTLFAVWEKAAGKLKYDANGGKGKIPEVSFGRSSLPAAAVNTFVRSGYHFLGWAFDADADEPDVYEGEYLGDFLNGAGDTVLYAVWERCSFIVSFDANGGTGEMVPVVFRCGQYYVLPQNTFTRKGYHFAGWSVKDAADGSVKYFDGQPVWNLCMTEGGTVVLVAEWTKE